ncbi:hypothetical protein Lalb_Chr11g0061701 [Lupinus albus]|uniref:DUF632 domain-containing protein n=1 Tax=Lupinus albus TaxID=3870 RepID=A0A6A4PQ69_LUPAL|nr:hypothetical protein Lalb_Chr11g0061701 [Lupinus albus]
MGCNTSKLDAITLCRERCKFVHQTLTQSCILADAHVKHIQSLQSLASALVFFFTQFQETHVSHMHFTSYEQLNFYGSKSPPPPPPPPATRDMKCRIIQIVTVAVTTQQRRGRRSYIMKSRQLKSMDKNGADAGKVETVQTSIGQLDTKMKMSIQVVDKISIAISKIREEELWSQIINFIHVMLKMWKDMQECYRCQYKEIAEAKALDASTFNRKLSSGQIDAAIKLKSVLQNWNLSFSNWINAQKSHVKALNDWLVRCLMYEPEEVPDDSTPLSPDNIGVPPVFVICNKWARTVDNISEKNTIEAVNGLMLRVSELLQKHILDLQQKLTVDRELESKVQILESQEQRMHKVVRAGERNIVPNPVAREESEAVLQRHVVHHGDFVDINNIQSDLKMIFSAMERFTALTAQLYEELCQQIKLYNPVLGESNKIDFLIGLFM